MREYAFFHHGFSLIGGLTWVEVEPITKALGTLSSSSSPSTNFIKWIKYKQIIKFNSTVAVEFLQTKRSRSTNKPQHDTQIYVENPSMQREKL
jgi:hypothetical protein